VRDENHLVLTPYPFAGHEILRLWAQNDTLSLSQHSVVLKPGPAEEMACITVRRLFTKGGAPMREARRVGKSAEAASTAVRNFLPPDRR
jgi:hypothetical protein